MSYGVLALVLTSSSILPWRAIASAHLAVLEWFARQILAVELAQIEGAQDHMLVIAALARVRKQRHGLVIAAHRLAVDQAGSNSITSSAAISSLSRSVRSIALAKGGTTVSSAAYHPVREMLASLSRSRAVQRFSPAKPQRCVTGRSASRPTPAIAKAKRIPWRRHRRFLCDKPELLPTARGECRSQPSD